LTSEKKKTNSIKVIARFFGSFKQATQKRDIEISIPNGSTVAILLAKIIAKHPSLQGLILDNNLQLGSWVVILINGRNMSIFEGVDTQLNDGDVVAVFPPVAGG
jgi:molybdopterin synthase sulfur carrier subunit